jgi:hypothetical protein
MMMMRSALLTTLFAATICSIAQGGLPECKGIGHPVLPGGFVDLGGSLIGTADGVEYGFQHVCKGRSHELWLQRVQTRDQHGNPIWSTLAKLALPRVRDGELLVFGHWSTCESDTSPDPAIVAIVKSTEGPRFTTIVHAWRANVQTGRFDAIPTTGIVCQNEDYGM